MLDVIDDVPAMARHRFATQPSRWCHPSWIDGVLGCPTGSPGSRLESALAWRYVDARLIDRYAPQPLDDDGFWTTPVSRLAVLPADWHRTLLRALGSPALGRLPNASIDDPGRLDAAIRAVREVGDVVMPGRPMTGVMMRDDSADAAIEAIGAEILLRLIATQPTAVRMRWRMRVPRTMVKRWRVTRHRADRRALARLAERLSAATGWGASPCW